MSQTPAVSREKQRSMIYAELKSLASEAQNRRGVSAAIRTTTPKSESLATSFDEHLLAEFKKLRPKSCWVSVYQPNLPFVTEQRVTIPSKRADGGGSQKIRFEIPRVGHLLNDAKMQVKMPPVTIRERHIERDDVTLTAGEVLFVETSGVEIQDSSANAYDGSDISATIVIDLSSETVDQITPGFEVAFDVSNGSHADLFEDDLTSFHMRPDISLARLQLTRVVAGVGSDVVLVDRSNVVGGVDLSGDITDPQGTSGDRRYKIEITPHAVDTSLTYDSSAGDFNPVNVTSDISLGSRADGFGAYNEEPVSYFKVAKVYDSNSGDISGVTTVSDIPTVSSGDGVIPELESSYGYVHVKATLAFEETELYSDFEPTKVEFYGNSGGTADISFNLSFIGTDYRGKEQAPGGATYDEIYVAVVKNSSGQGQKDTYDIKMTFVDQVPGGVDTYALFEESKIKIHGEESQRVMSYVHNKLTNAFTAPAHSNFVPQVFTLFDTSSNAADISFDLSANNTSTIFTGIYDVSAALNERIVAKVVRNPGVTLDSFDIFMTWANNTSDANENPIDDYFYSYFKIEGTEQAYDSSMTLSNVAFTANAAETTPNYGGYVWGLGHHMIENVDFLCNDKVVQTIPEAGFALHAYEHLARRGGGQVDVPARGRDHPRAGGDVVAGEHDVREPGVVLLEGGAGQRAAADEAGAVVAAGCRGDAASRGRTDVVAAFEQRSGHRAQGFAGRDV